MKKIIILILISISITVLSQGQCPPNNGDNINRPELDKFEGTWKYSGNGIEATLMLKKIHSHFNYPTKSYYSDLLVGVYKVVSGIQVLFDNTNEYNDLALTTYRPKLILDIKCNKLNEPNKVVGFLRDVVKLKTVNIKATYVASSTPEIIFRQINPERFGLTNINGTIASHDIFNPNGSFNPAFTIPNNVNFIKQP